MSYEEIININVSIGYFWYHVRSIIGNHEDEVYDYEEILHSIREQCHRLHDLEHTDILQQLTGGRPEKGNIILLIS